MLIAGRPLRHFIITGIIMMSVVAFQYWSAAKVDSILPNVDISTNVEESEKCASFQEIDELMVAVLLRNDESGYADFTSSIFRKVLCAPERNIHIFGRVSDEKVLEGYGKQASYHRLKKNSDLVEDVANIFEHFQASEFNVLLTVTPDMVVSTKTFEFVLQNIQSRDVLRLFRNDTKCQEAGEDLCIDDTPTVFGSAITKASVAILPKNTQSLKQTDEFDIAIQVPNINSVFSKESFILRIRQTFHPDGCVEYFRTYNFNRCQLPKWVQDGIEFYLDKCNKPNSTFARISEDETFYAKPVVSYSLYGGDNPRYSEGALANSELMFSIYPEWKMWVYVDNSVPNSLTQTLCKRNVKLIDMSGTNLTNKMSWRFLVASEPVHRYIIRDIDSRLSLRERAAVYEWIESGKKFHVMRDHPAHSLYAMSGGMWGGIHDSIPSMRAMLESLPLDGAYLKDMDFLNEKVWPIAKESVWQNDAFNNEKYGVVHPFPTPRVGLEHVGSVFINGKQRESDSVILKKALEEMNKNLL